MRIHDVRTRRSADDFPRSEHLAWKIAEVAADPVAVPADVEAMVINRIIDNAAVSAASVVRRPVAVARAQARAHPAAAKGAKVFGIEGDYSPEWAAWANREGLSACEKLIARQPGPFCFGEVPTIADLCLVPQLANARRFGVDVAAFPRLLQAEAAAKAMKEFADASPDRQSDAE